MKRKDISLFVFFVIIPSLFIGYALRRQTGYVHIPACLPNRDEGRGMNGKRGGAESQRSDPNEWTFPWKVRESGRCRRLPRRQANPAHVNSNLRSESPRAYGGRSIVSIQSLYHFRTSHSYLASRWTPRTTLAAKKCGKWNEYIWKR